MNSGESRTHDGHARPERQVMNHSDSHHLTTGDNMSTDWLGPPNVGPSLEDVGRPLSPLSDLNHFARGVDWLTT